MNNCDLDLSTLAINKIYHYKYNLDYSFYNLENQTNNLISFIINDFIYNYQNKFKEYQFVYNYNDDILSIIGLFILNGIKSLDKDFNYYLIGKIKKTKKFIKFKPQEYKYKNKKPIIFINSYNPIFKVIFSKYLSKFLKRVDEIKETYNILEKFTNEEILEVINFYNLAAINSKFITEQVEDFYNKSHWYNDLRKDFQLEKLVQIPFNLKIKFVWIENNENDIKVLQEIEQTNALVFYFYNSKEKPPILDNLTFKSLLKKKTNIPDERFLNLNNYELPVYLTKIYNLSYNFIGNWVENEKQKLLKNLTMEENNK